MRFDIERDLTPVTRGVVAPMVLAATAASGVNSFGELAALGERNPGGIFQGSAGEALEPVFETPAELAAWLREERAPWRSFIQRQGFTPEP